jgi:hypothetical protein
MALCRDKPVSFGIIGAGDFQYPAFGQPLYHVAWFCLFAAGDETGYVFLHIRSSLFIAGQMYENI